MTGMETNTAAIYLRKSSEDEGKSVAVGLIKANQELNCSVILQVLCARNSERQQFLQKLT